MTFEELLDAVPHLRFRRSLSADSVRKLLGRQKGECTWCGGELKGRRTRWCGDDCVNEFLGRCSPSNAAHYVWRRDAGICQLCGRNIDRCMRVFFVATGYQIGTRYRKPRDEFAAFIAPLLGFGRGTWGEVDHIKAVADGGGLCSTDNLRLVCGACHADRTAEQSRKNSRCGDSG